VVLCYGSGHARFGPLPVCPALSPESSIFSTLRDSPGLSHLLTFPSLPLLNTLPLSAPCQAAFAAPCPPYHQMFSPPQAFRVSFSLFFFNSPTSGKILPHGNDFPVNFYDEPSFSETVILYFDVVAFFIFTENSRPLFFFSLPEKSSPPQAPQRLGVGFFDSDQSTFSAAALLTSTLPTTTAHYFLLTFSS